MCNFNALFPSFFRLGVFRSNQKSASNPYFGLQSLDRYAFSAISSFAPNPSLYRSHPRRIPWRPTHCDRNSSDAIGIGEDIPAPPQATALPWRALIVHGIIQDLSRILWLLWDISGSSVNLKLMEALMLSSLWNWRNFLLRLVPRIPSTFHRLMIHFTSDHQPCVLYGPKTQPLCSKRMCTMIVHPFLVFSGWPLKRKHILFTIHYLLPGRLSTILPRAARLPAHGSLLQHNEIVEPDIFSFFREKKDMATASLKYLQVKLCIHILGYTTSTECQPTSYFLGS